MQKLNVSYPPTERLAAEKWDGAHTATVFRYEHDNICVSLTREDHHWPLMINLTPKFMAKLLCAWVWRYWFCLYLRYSVFGKPIHCLTKALYFLRNLRRFLPRTS